MYDASTPAPPCTLGNLLPLVDVVELKWLLAGQGVHVHVERLQADTAYAAATLARAEACAEPAARAVALRLRRLLAAA